MRQTILAQRYARALFSLGKEKGKNESYSKTLGAIAELYKEESIENALINPLYPVEARQKVMAKIGELAKADTIMARFLDLLVEKKRADILPDIAEQMRVMVDQEQNISHGSVVSAIKLDDKLKKKIQQTLEKITGNKVILEASVDPTIIGGVIAKVGDLVLDGSIKTQLNGLKESIKGRE